MSRTVDLTTQQAARLLADAQVLAAAVVLYVPSNEARLQRCAGRVLKAFGFPALSSEYWTRARRVRKRRASAVRPPETR